MADNDLVISDIQNLKVAVIIIIVSFSNSDILNSKWQIITLLFSFVKYLTQAASENFRSTCFGVYDDHTSSEMFIFANKLDNACAAAFSIQSDYVIRALNQ